MKLTLDVRPLFPSSPALSRAKLTRIPCMQINTDLLTLSKDADFSLALATTLNPDADKSGAAASGGWRADLQSGLADDWEYVMYGKVRFLPHLSPLALFAPPELTSLPPPPLPLAPSRSRRCTSSTRARQTR